jgi:16S rRNA (uracil1498-N3)-methyltransferase
LTSNQFFVARVDGGTSRVVLRDAEHHHLARVVRVRAGSLIWLSDSEGRRYRARVETVGSDRTEVEIVGRDEQPEPGARLILAQALLAAKKMEFVLQKATEFGFSDFQPLETARSLRTPAERSGRKRERWLRIAREAVKQSKGRRPPEIHEALSLRAFLGASRRDGIRFFLSERVGTPLRSVLAGPSRSTGRPGPVEVVLCVGPEGGWTEEEERGLSSAGFGPVSLGRRVLRAETAALAGAAMISHFWDT